ncbi:MAG TPA: hypothetical protein PLQ57_01720 [Saprospiraceae bacterium]|nr:hypothetical protein [Saprospiraceae bacterium]
MKEFDKIIRSKMQKAEAPYPSDMWQRIQQNLPEKKRKTYPVWLYFMVLLFVISGLGLWAGSQWWGSSTTDQPEATNKQSADSSPIASQGGTTHNLNPTTDGSETTESQARASKAKVESSLTVAGKASKSNPSQKSKATLNTINNVADNSNSGATPDGTSQINSTEAVTSSFPSFIAEADEINGAQRLTRRGERINTTTIPSFLRVFGTDQSDVIEEINSSMKKHSALQCPSFVRKDNVTFFELYFSNDYAIKSLHEKNAEGSGYRALREKTESPYLSYSAGFRIGMGWNNGLAFKTGFNYSNINEKFSYTDPNSVQIQTITTVKYIYDDQFNIIDSIKTTENVEIPGTNTVTHYNKIALYDIPLLVQYTIPGKRRLSYSLVVGPLVNLSLVQSGKILDPYSNKLVKLQEAEIYKNNIGLSFYGGLGINYQLTKNVQMSIEPNFRWMPGSITKVTHPVDQSYFLANVAAAIRYKI